MKLHLVAVGRLRPAYRALCDTYLGRLGRTATCLEHEVREASSAPDVATQQAREAEALRARLPPGATVVALDRLGEGWTSEQLAERLDGWRHEARPVAFVLGGPHGLDPSLARAARHRWSLGPPTLPHELARLVVCEQLYRAVSILRAEPYHK
ncbi:MAG: 23S rRNA (pseudouridine(1915)-N(3))-methyltransferase RlmH [Gemmatimonadales bacterium]|nr:23S rRNA (pseudouridine(1915)-N(3))-methyltransferase RlmH [Gemmatimonadales bacterium]